MINKLYEVYSSIKSPYEKKWKKKDFTSLILKEHTIFLLAKPKPIGYLLARIILDEIEIISLLIKKNHRRKGKGRDLLLDLCSLAGEKNITKIILEVSVENRPAKKLYESLNFKKVGVRKNYYNIEDKKEDAQIMALSIL